MHKTVFNNNRENPQELLDIKTQELNDLVSQYSMESIIRPSLFAMQIHTMTEFKLLGSQSSPVKQIGYLTEIALHSNGNKKLTTSAFQKTLTLLEEIEQLYRELQSPNKKSLSTNNFEKEIIAANYFFNRYFNTDLVYVEQAEDRYLRTFAPITDKIVEKTGLSLSDFDRFFRQVLFIFKTKRKNAIDVFFSQNFRDDDTFNDKYISYYIEHNVYYFTPEITDLGITIEDMLPCGLEQHKIEKLFKLFTAKQNITTDKIYYGSKQQIDETPFIEINKGSFILFSEIQLPVAIYRQLMHLVEVPNLSSKLRAKYLEAKTADCFRTFFDSSVDIYTNYYINEESQEKDLLIIKGNSAYIIECKSDKMIEAFRNTEKSYFRIRRDFKTSIQKVYDQAVPVFKAITEYENIDICDKNGNIKKIIDCNHISRTYILLVTQERYGLYQNDLSLLLEKQEDKPFPYSISIDDLETLLLTLHRMPSAQYKLNEYLILREKMNGKIYTDDELDIASEFIIDKPNLVQHLNKEDMITFSPHCCDFFDDLYHFNGIGFNNEDYDNKFGLTISNVRTYYFCNKLNIRPTKEAIDYMEAKGISFSKIMLFIEKELTNKETEAIMKEFWLTKNKQIPSLSEFKRDYTAFKEWYLRDK